MLCRTLSEKYLAPKGERFRTAEEQWVVAASDCTGQHPPMKTGLLVVSIRLPPTELTWLGAALPVRRLL